MEDERAILLWKSIYKYQIHPHKCFYLSVFIWFTLSWYNCSFILHLSFFRHIFVPISSFFRSFSHFSHQLPSLFKPLFFSSSLFCPFIIQLLSFLKFLYRPKKGRQGSEWSSCQQIYSWFVRVVMVMSHQWVRGGTYFCIIGRRLLRWTITITKRISTVAEEMRSKFAPNFGMQEFESLTILSMCWQTRGGFPECCRQRWREEDWRWDSCKVKCQRSRDVQKNNGGADKVKS